jgi:hypothetical protein
MAKMKQLEFFLLIFKSQIENQVSNYKHLGLSCFLWIDYLIIFHYIPYNIPCQCFF